MPEAKSTVAKGSTSQLNAQKNDCPVMPRMPESSDDVPEQSRMCDGAT